jgi:hypothetical protein
MRLLFPLVGLRSFNQAIDRRSHLILALPDQEETEVNE